jgi:hypothetical protein
VSAPVTVSTTHPGELLARATGVLSGAVINAPSGA